MSIIILTAAESIDLTLKETIQTQLKLAIGTDDEIFEQLITAASQFIMDYTNRLYAREQWEELIAADNTNWLQLTLTPIDTINSITVQGIAITDYIIEDVDAGLLFREKGWEASLSFHRGVVRQPIVRSSLPRVKVDYDGGYVLPSFSIGTVNIPASLEQACIDLVRIWYKEVLDNLPGNVKQIKIGDYSISFGTDGADDPNTLGVPAQILGKLSSYRRIV